MRNSLLLLGPIKLGVTLFQNFADNSKLLLHNDINNIFYLIDWSEVKILCLLNSYVERSSFPILKNLQLIL